MSAPTRIRTKSGDMIDLVCVLHYGDRPGVVEAVLEANPGLAALPPLLPPGTVIVLPDAPAERLPTLQKLWD